MKKLSTLFHLLPILFFANIAFAQPANDNLADTITLSNTTFPSADVVTNAEAQAATFETDELICEGSTASWWYSFTPTISTDYIIKSEVIGSTANDNSDDIRLGIYTGTAHPLTEVFCFDGDNGDGFGEDVRVPLTADTTYLIRVAPNVASAIVGDITTSVNVFNTWDGSESDDWSDTQNWSLGTIPTATSLVQFLGSVPNEPVIKSGTNAAASFIAILDGISLTIDDGGTLTVAGNEDQSMLLDNALSTLFVNGKLSLSNSEDKGLDVEDGALNVGATGQVTITNTDVGIDLEEANTSIIDGQLTISNIGERGIILQDEVALDIGANATVDISFTGLDGIFLTNPNTQLNIDGSVLIEEADDDGIDVIAGTVSIGITGVVTIDEVGDNGTEDITGSNAGQITITNVADEALNTGGATFTNESTGIINLSDAGEDCMDIGDVLVNEGIVIANNCDNQTIVDGTFNNNADAILSADGLISSSSTVFADSSILEVGNSPGCITFTQGEDFSGAILRFEIEGTTVCTEYDNIEVGGALTLNDAVLELSGSYTPQLGDEFTIFQNDNTTDAVVGTFAGLSEGSTIRFNNTELTISYIGGNGNEVILTTTDIYECISEIAFTDETVAESVYRSASTITTTGIVDLENNGEIFFEATDSIVLSVGFSTTGAESFSASIIACTTNDLQEIEERNIATLDDSVLKSTNIQVYPNPVQGGAILQLNLSEATRLQVSIFDISGRQLQHIINQHFSSGAHQLSLPIAHLNSGIYFLRIQTAQWKETVRIVVE
ncbi:MAG: T9SS type A sorting domain-containing protein [Bacteroidota bacterium]